MFLINTILVDDDEISLMTVEYALKRFCPEVNVVGKFSSPAQALEMAHSIPLDIVFLDIKMEEMNGIELAKRFNSMSIRTVFISSYDQFALQALRVNAVDFLMKPINPDELVATIARTKLAILSKEQKMQSLITNASLKFKKKATHKYVALPTINDITIADMGEILYCEGIGNYTKVVFKHNVEITLSKTLGLLESTLDSNLFVRIHNKFLVNFIHASKLVRKRGGGDLIMLDGRKIPISKSRRKYFMSKIAVLS